MIIMILITKAFPQRLVPAAGFSASSCQRASTSLDMPSKSYDMDMDMDIYGYGYGYGYAK